MTALSPSHGDCLYAIIPQHNCLELLQARRYTDMLSRTHGSFLSMTLMNEPSIDDSRPYRSPKLRRVYHDDKKIEYAEGLGKGLSGHCLFCPHRRLLLCTKGGK